MLVLPQKVKVRWHGMNKKWYMEKGYEFTKIRDEFEVDVLDLMSNSTQYVEISCDFCGSKLSKEYGKYNETHKETHDSCDNCSSKKLSKIRSKYTIEYVREEFENRGYTLLENEYINNHIPMKYICDEGHKTDISFKSLLKGHGCRNCGAQKAAMTKRRSIEEIRSIFEESNCLLLTKEYINPSQTLDYVCECGNVDHKDLNHFLRGQRCEKCATRKRREAFVKYDLDEVKDIFRENGCTLLENEYLNSNATMRYICACERPSKTSLTNFLRGARCRKCAAENMSGENHPHWNPNLSEEERENERNIEGYSEWRIAVYKRDYYTCQCCGYKGGNLRAHHLDGYNWCVEKRTDVGNAVTLCAECHDIQYEGSFHNVYGNGNNTKEQYEEWIKNKLIEKEDLYVI